MSNLSQYLVHLDEPLSKNNETGRGCYGVVYRSRLNGAKCVVKRLHDILTGGGGQQSVSETEWRAVVAKFRQEIELLSKQRHPNIVQFLGVCGLDGDPRDISLVMEQLDDDLTAFIENNKGKISLCMKLSILRGVACGLNHLHSTGIVHRDLNAGNVLLTSSLHAKVADLGVSRIIDSRPRYLSGLTLVPGAIDYMPPEALRPDPVYGPKLDCFSFGHLALYLAVEVYPRPSELADYELDLRTGQDGQLLICLQVQKRKQWIQRIGEDHPLNELICVCLSDPQQRPDMETVRQRLEEKMNNDNIPKFMDVLKEKQELKQSIEEKDETIRKLKIFGIPGVCGLINLGGTCFMNSILQCLNNTQSLTRYFLEEQSTTPRPEEAYIEDTYENLLKMMWNIDNFCIAPRDLVKIINDHAPSSAHRDSHEMLVYILNRLHADLNIIFHGQMNSIKKSKDNPTEAWQDHLLYNQSVIVDTFHGQFRTTLNCSRCDKNFLEFDPFTTLSLPIPALRGIYVYLVRADPMSDIVKYRISVPKNGIALNLKQKIQRETGISFKNLVVIDVYHSRFHKVYYDNDTVSQIMDRDDIYVYELTTPLGDQDWVPIPVPVYMRETRVQKSYSYFSKPASTTYGQVFGLPIVVTVPREGCTYRYLYSAIIRRTSRYILQQKTDDEEKMECIGKDRETNVDLFKLIMVNSYGSQEVQQLNDDDTKLILTSNTYVSCDWELDIKEKYYDVRKAEEFYEDESCDGDNIPITLFDCFDLFVQQEKMNNETAECPECKSSTEVSNEKVDLWKLPKVLIIHSKRFSARNKVESKIEFPLKLTALDLSKYIANKQHSQTVYDLYAVCNHSGSQEEGHYTAYCKNQFTGKWYCFDDEEVSEISEDSVCSSSSYILFYCRAKQQK